MTTSSITTKPPSILLVDDDADTRFIVREAFEHTHSSWKVYEVSSGEEAIDFLYRRDRHAGAPRPDLVCMDIEMPGMGGQATLAKIRQNKDFDDIPVFMMTSMTDEIQERLAATNGANSYTVKPATLAELHACVSHVAEHWASLQQEQEDRTRQ